MALSRTDQAELVLPLFEDLSSDAPWDRFLVRLMARTGADRAQLLESDGRAALARRWRQAVPERSAADPASETRALGGPPAALRPNRVYALDELRLIGEPPAQAAALAAAGIDDARLIRIRGADVSVWIILMIARGCFDAADGALLANLAPSVAAAAAQQTAMALLRARLAAAEDTLMLLGVGQAVLEPDGAVLVADPLWQSTHPALTVRQGSASLAPGERRVVTTGSCPVLLRALAGSNRTVASFRLDPPPLPANAAAILERTLDLSAREAMLAALLAHGWSLIEAGRHLRLTDETARNYSKRIYAKTGARGQADLVRRVLTGLAPLG